MAALSQHFRCHKYIFQGEESNKVVTAAANHVEGSENQFYDQFLERKYTVNFFLEKITAVEACAGPSDEKAKAAVGSIGRGLLDSFKANLKKDCHFVSKRNMSRSCREVRNSLDRNRVQK